MLLIALLTSTFIYLFSYTTTASLALSPSTSPVNFRTLLESFQSTDVVSKSALLSFESYFRSEKEVEDLIIYFRSYKGPALEMVQGQLFSRHEYDQAVKIVQHFESSCERHYLVNSERERIGVFIIEQESKRIYISFTGTDKLADWLKNFGWNKKNFQFFGKTIGTADGFYSACSERLPILFESLDQEIARLGINVKEYEFILSGHSLGGAIAGLATYKIYEKYDLHLKDGIFNSNNQVKLITFGCPRYLLKGEGLFIGNDNALRIRHDMDSVPNASKNFARIDNYAHFGHKLILALPLWYDNPFFKWFSSILVTQNHSMQQYLLSAQATIHNIHLSLPAPENRERESLDEIYIIVCREIKRIIGDKHRNAYRIIWSLSCNEDSVICSLLENDSEKTIPLIEFAAQSYECPPSNRADENFINELSSFVAEFPCPAKGSLCMRRVQGEDGKLTNFIPLQISKVHQLLFTRNPELFNALFISHSPVTSPALLRVATAAHSSTSSPLIPRCSSSGQLYSGEKEEINVERRCRSTSPTMLVTQQPQPLQDK